MLSLAEQDIIDDFNQAKDATSEFILPFISELSVRGAIIGDATKTFADFLDLPETDSTLSKIFSVAFMVLVNAIPVLSAVKALGMSQQAIEVASALGDARAKALKIGGEVSEKLKKGKEIGDAAVEKVEKKVAQSEAMKKLKEQDPAMAPIRELLNSSKTAVRQYCAVNALLDLEEHLRLREPTKRAPESMVDMADRLLPKLEEFDDDDVDQIKGMYLWNMMADYAKDHVSIQIVHDTNGQNTMNIEGFNNTQQNYIVKYFNGVKRPGHYFWPPPMPNIYMFLGAWKVRTESHRFQSDLVNKM